MTDNTDSIVPERTDTPTDQASGTTPVAERKRRRLGPRLALIGVVLITGLAVVYFAVADRKPDGPTLESRFQQQQLLIDQLRGQLDDLQADQDVRASARERLANQLEALTSRVETNERFQQDPDRQALPAQIDALTKRLDELSGSVDLRFGAAQEKEQA
ncbi:hypothetical protein BIS06_07655, partial [Halomonas sp. BBD48]|nr:hypothetical protein [Halomonas sp. BBD48]